MQVLFDAQDKDGWQLRSVAVHRIREATRRLGWLTQRARVRLDAVRDARAGLDKRCRIEFARGRASSVVVTSTARDWSRALDVAVRSAVAKLQSAPRAGRGPVPHRVLTTG